MNFLLYHNIEIVACSLTGIGQLAAPNNKMNNKLSKAIATLLCFVVILGVEKNFFVTLTTRFYADNVASWNEINNNNNQEEKNMTSALQPPFIRGSMESLFDVTPVLMAKTVTSENENRKIIKVLLTFLVGTDNANRTATFLQNLNVLNTTNTFKRKYELHCLVLNHASYAQAKAFGLLHEKVVRACSVVFLYKFPYTKKLAFLDPFLLRKAKYDYVTVILDDVQLTGSFDLEKFYDLIVRYDLAIASPSVTRSFWKHMERYNRHPPVYECPGRFVAFVEVQATTFRMDAWECFYELNDPRFPTGLGADIWFEGYCIKTNRVKNANLAVIDWFLVDHLALPSTRATVSQEFDVEAQITDWKDPNSRNFTLVRTYVGDSRDVCVNRTILLDFKHG